MLNCEGILFFDFEYTCWENSISTNWSDKKKPPEVIQVGFVYYDISNGSISSKFSDYIKPVINPVLSNYCLKLLQIKNEILFKAPILNDFIPSLQKSLRTLPDNMCICSWGVEDYLFFDNDCRRQKQNNPLAFLPYFDLMRLAMNIIGNDSKMGLDREYAKKILGIENSGNAHNALDDAIELITIFEKIDSYNE